MAPCFKEKGRCGVNRNGLFGECYLITWLGMTSAKPASSICPPMVWRQWMAMVFGWPTLMVARALGEILTAWKFGEKPPLCAGRGHR